MKHKNVKLSSYLARYWKLAVIAPLFIAGEVVVDLMQPKLMSDIVNNGVLTGDMGYCLRTGVMMLVLVVIGGALGVASAAFASAAAQNFGNDLRCDAFDRVMHLSLQQTDKFTTGSLVTRLTNDITATQDFVSMLLRMFVRAPLSFIGGIIMAVSLNINFGFALALALPLELIIIAVILGKAGPLFGKVQSKLDRVNSVVQENITGARMVKAYVREDYEEKRFKKANDDLMDTTFKVQKMLSIAMPVVMFVMNMTIIAIILIGGLQVQAGRMQVGNIMAGVNYVTQILFSIMMVSMMFQMISRARASAARVREVLNTEPVIADGNGRTDENSGTVEFKNVSFAYPEASGTPILHNISFKINRGETVAVLGATGSGKTSLLNLITRFYDPTDGEILVDGLSVREYKLEELRNKVGFVLQKSELFSGTVAENIRWGDPDADENEVKRAAKIAQADEFIEGFKNKYNTPISEKGASLSGGQKQRISIARAIIKKPEILIFDDSTSALDLGTEARLQKALRENLNDTTVIMIAQRVASVKNADRIIVLEGGTAAACGTHEELLATSEVYRDICNSQLGKEEE